MKDFTKIKEIIEEKGEIKSKELKELGYSTYDINLFMNSNLLVRASRGVYSIPSVTEDKTNSAEAETKTPESDISSLCKEGTYNLAKSFYFEAEKSFVSVLEQEPDHYYANKALAMINAYRSEFEQTYTFLMKSYDNLDNEKYTANYYIFLLMLSKVIDVPEDVLADFQEKSYAYFKKQETNYYRYFQKIVFNLKNGNLEKAHTAIFYLLKNDSKKRKYNLDNNFMYTLLKNVIQKLNVSNEINVEEVAEEIAEAEKEPVIVVPPVDEALVLNNTLILNYINAGDYEAARNLLAESAVTNKDEVIDALLRKLISIKEVLLPSLPQKVKSVEPVTIIDKALIDEEVRESTEQRQDKKTALPEVPTTKPIEETPKIEVALEDKIDEQYQNYKRQYESYQFDEARRSLIHYEMFFKQSGQCRNIRYHYQRIENDKIDYETNPEAYIEFCNLKAQLIEDLRNKDYEEAILIAEKMCQYNLHNFYAQITLAKIYNDLNQPEKAYEILMPFADNCEEPEFFVQMAKANFGIKNYQEALECCIKFNERRPRSSAANYVLMSKCYNKLRKYGKELKALLTADEINKKNGKNIDLSDSISKATASANHNHELILAKINNKNVDFD